MYLPITYVFLTQHMLSCHLLRYQGYLYYKPKTPNPIKIVQPVRFLTLPGAPFLKPKRSAANDASYAGRMELKSLVSVNSFSESV